MSKIKWHSGPPPHVGWWNASVNKIAGVWRWWNGIYWSYAAISKDDAVEAARLASGRAIARGPIYWRTYYPKNARVQRINQNTLRNS